MSYSLSSDEFLSAFSQCEKISALFSASADLATAVDFEMALARAQASLSIIPAKDADIICKLLSETKLTPADFSQGVSTDGIYVPAFVASIRGKLPDTTAASFHKSTTSQDVIDTSLMIRLRKACRHVSNALATLQHSLKNLDHQIGERQISARTRMQNALPFTMSDKIETWQIALQACQKDQPEEFPIQLGGPIGMMQKNEPQWDALVKRMASELKLTPVKNPWHTNRKPVIDICSWLVSINAVLGKLGQDVCLMSQNGIEDIKLQGGGTSSAMPHKNNPVLAETLVTLARYNAGLMGILHQSSIHENERSGTAWTLEFMTVPQVAITTSASLNNALHLLKNLA